MKYPNLPFLPRIMHARPLTLTLPPSMTSLQSTSHIPYMYVRPTEPGGHSCLTMLILFSLQLNHSYLAHPLPLMVDDGISI